MEGGGGRIVSAAACWSPPGFPAPAGITRTRGHVGFTLASADTQIQDFSLGSVQLQTGLDTCAARTCTLIELKTLITAHHTSELHLNTS